MWNFLIHLIVMFVDVHELGDFLADSRDETIEYVLSIIYSDLSSRLGDRRISEASR
jgi:hypothetical protein